ncbi:MAG: hypothetical protein ABSF34_03030 [Verrucomicrobiota bacterium]
MGETGDNKQNYRLNQCLNFFAAVCIALTCLHAAAKDDLGIVDTPCVVGLVAEATSTNVTLTWPSAPCESFAVLWRSNATYQAQWAVLANPFQAAAKSDHTVFHDENGLIRLAHNAITNLAGLYAVYVIPDFWFNMQNVNLCGGPKIPSEDFVPFYYGIDGFGFPQPDVELVVDGEEANWGPVHAERVNFAMPRNPRWIDVWGFWFRIDLVTNGVHALQLHSMLELNNSIGPWTQEIFLTNKMVQVTVTINGYKHGVENWWINRLGRGFDLPTNAAEYGAQFLQSSVNPPASKIPVRPLDLLDRTASSLSSDMILDLGEISDNIKITPEYSNAVLVAVLPYFSNVSKTLQLPTPQPITLADVEKFNILPFRQTRASVRLKNGCVFSFADGFVDTYTSPRSPSYSRPTSDEIVSSPKNLSESDAVKLARDAIEKLGIPLEDVFADWEPTVTKYNKAIPNSVARYRIQWPDPRDGHSAADFIINPETAEIERFHFETLGTLQRPSPVTDIVPQTAEEGRDTFASQIPSQKINPDYAWKLIPMMLKAVDEYGQKLSLPIPCPLTTNEIAKIHIFNNDGWPHCEITLTNGWRFIYRHTMVNGYYSPNIFVTADNRPFHINDFKGKWNLTVDQAISLVKENLARLNYTTNNIHMDFAPHIIFAAGDFKNVIPRYFFEWDYQGSMQDDLQSKIEAEVNADNGKLESLYYDDKAYWNARPPINVPISTDKKEIPQQ